MTSGPRDNESAVTPDAHAVELTVWDVPSATTAGERFAVSVGARCPAGCDLGGRELILFDQDGARAGTAPLGRDVWPGTEALHVARIEASAPLGTGSHQWEARFAGRTEELPHAPCSFPLIIRVVPPPECEITVRAVDRERQAPIAGARVVLHPYRAVTNDNGIAKVRVARGTYDLLVSGSRYLPACASVEVNDDMMTTTELEADRPWAPLDEDAE